MVGRSETLTFETLIVAFRAPLLWVPIVLLATFRCPLKRATEHLGLALRS